jgi:hypothetical protein
LFLPEDALSYTGRAFRGGHEHFARDETLEIAPALADAVGEFKGVV